MYIGREMDIFCIHNEILFSFKNKEILAYAVIWKNLVDIILSEISHSQKDKYYMISFIGGI
jgi:hypothetical protein